MYIGHIMADFRLYSEENRAMKNFEKFWDTIVPNQTWIEKLVFIFGVNGFFEKSEKIAYVPKIEHA